MSSRAVDRSTDSAHGLRPNAATFLRGVMALVLFATAVLVVGGTTAADAPTYAYDAPIIARTHAHEINAADARSALLSVAKEESARPLAEARGASTTSAGPVVATNNPVPGRVSRIVEEDVLDRGMMTLGHPSSSDVFVTAADDIAGLNSAQIGEHLTLLDGTCAVRKGPFAVIEFDTPSGIASPLNRTNPGFINGGRAAGGAREFVVPNSPLDQLTNVVIRRPG